jgi:hypothetical protein
MGMKKVIGLFILLAAASVFNSCSITLNGASIPPKMKTIYVQYIENNALFVKNGLSQSITEALKSRIRSQTRLSIVNTPEADGTFSGAITSYTIAPVSIQATGNSNAPPIANASRLTVTVKIKFTINFPDATTDEKKLAYEQDFTKTADFTGDIGTQEDALLININKQLTEDIFNKAFAEWK